eukprot:6184981-Pleurochrysis_carterae.AAC.1
MSVGDVVAQLRDANNVHVEWHATGLDKLVGVQLERAVPPVQVFGGQWPTAERHDRCLSGRKCVWQ